MGGISTGDGILRDPGSQLFDSAGDVFLDMTQHPAVWKSYMAGLGFAEQATAYPFANADLAGPLLTSLSISLTDGIIGTASDPGGIGPATLSLGLQDVPSSVLAGPLTSTIVAGTNVKVANNPTTGVGSPEVSVPTFPWGDLTGVPTLVNSWNGRTGAVVPASGDYSFSQISGTASPSQLPSNVAYLDLTQTWAAEQTYSAGITGTGSVGTLTVPWGNLTGVPALVSSFNSRTGAVVPASGDYSFSLISGQATNAQLAGNLVDSITAGSNVAVSNPTGVGAAKVSVPSFPWTDLTGVPTTLAYVDLAQTWADEQTFSGGITGTGSVGALTVPWGNLTSVPTLVNSWNGRTGAVVPATGDYSFSQISGTATSGQLPADVAYLDAAQSWTAQQTLTAGFSVTGGNFEVDSSAEMHIGNSGTGGAFLRIAYQSGSLYLEAWNAALTGAASSMILSGYEGGAVAVQTYYNTLDDSTGASLWHGLATFSAGITGTGSVGALTVPWGNLTSVPNLVNSWNGRTGAVSPASGDYSFSQISGTAANSQLAGPVVSALTAGTNVKVSNPTGVGAATVSVPTFPWADLTGVPTTLAYTDSAQTWADEQTFSAGITGTGSVGSLTVPWGNLTSVPTLVNSFNGRTGAVSPASGDYTPTMVGFSAYPISLSTDTNALSNSWTWADLQTFNAGLVANLGSTNNTAITLTSSGAGWGSGIQFTNTAPTTAQTWGFYASSSGKFHGVNSTASIDWLIIDVGDDFPTFPNGITGTGSVGALTVPWANLTSVPNLVNSFNGRTGTVIPATDDYSFSQISGTATSSQLPSTVAYLDVAQSWGAQQTFNDEILGQNGANVNSTNAHSDTSLSPFLAVYDDGSVNQYGMTLWYGSTNGGSANYYTALVSGPSQNGWALIRSTSGSTRPSINSDFGLYFAVDIDGNVWAAGTLTVTDLATFSAGITGTGSVGSLTVPWDNLTGTPSFVNSFNGRTGAVVPVTGDYSFSLISGAATKSQLPTSTAYTDAAQTWADEQTFSAGITGTGTVGALTVPWGNLTGVPSLVNSFNGRSGTVAPTSGDYTPTMVGFSAYPISLSTDTDALSGAWTWGNTQTYSGLTVHSAGVQAQFIQMASVPTFSDAGYADAAWVFRYNESGNTASGDAYGAVLSINATYQDVSGTYTWVWQDQYTVPTILLLDGSGGWSVLSGGTQSAPTSQQQPFTPTTLFAMDNTGEVSTGHTWSATQYFTGAFYVDNVNGLSMYDANGTSSSRLNFFKNTANDNASTFRFDMYDGTSWYYGAFRFDAINGLQAPGISASSAKYTFANLATFSAGITGSGTTGSLTAGTGILGAANTWTALQTYNQGITAAATALLANQNYSDTGPTVQVGDSGYGLSSVDATLYLWSDAGGFYFYAKDSSGTYQQIAAMTSAGITGTGTTGTLAAGTGILGAANTWADEQTFSAGITGTGSIGSLTAPWGNLTSVPSLVNTFNGRSGAVTPASDDYAFSQISGTATSSQLPSSVAYLDAAQTWADAQTMPYLTTTESGTVQWGAAGAPWAGWAQAAPTASGAGLLVWNSAPAPVAASVALLGYTDLPTIPSGAALMVSGTSSFSGLATFSAGITGTGSVGSLTVPWGNLTSVPSLVNTFNGRTGAVVPAAGDYSFSDISGTATSSQLPSEVAYLGTAQTWAAAQSFSDTLYANGGLQVSGGWLTAEEFIDAEGGVGLIPLSTVANTTSPYLEIAYYDSNATEQMFAWIAGDSGNVGGANTLGLWSGMASGQTNKALLGIGLDGSVYLSGQVYLTGNLNVSNWTPLSLVTDLNGSAYSYSLSYSRGFVVQDVTGARWMLHQGGYRWNLSQETTTAGDFTDILSFDTGQSAGVGTNTYLRNIRPSGNPGLIFEGFGVYTFEATTAYMTLNSESTSEDVSMAFQSNGVDVMAIGWHNSSGNRFISVYDGTNWHETDIDSAGNWTFPGAVTASTVSATDGSVHGSDTYTSSGSWTCPAGVYTALVELWGGGGGGGGGAVYGAGGGGSGAYVAFWMSVSPGYSYAFTIGGGGSAGSPQQSGGAGGGTTFTANGTTAGGGGAGTFGQSNAPGDGGAGGAGGFPAWVVTGYAGGNGSGTSGGAGNGASYGPAGGSGGGPGVAGGTGGSPGGGGGGGGGNSNGVGAAGGSGGAGQVRISW